MILTSHQLLQELKDENKFRNFKKENIKQNFYTLNFPSNIFRFVDEFKTIETSKVIDYDNYKKLDISAGYNIRPNEYITVFSNEWLNIESNIIISIKPNTNIVNTGLIVNVTDIASEYKGNIVVGIYNPTPFVIKVQKEIPLLNLFFNKQDEDDHDYNEQEEYNKEYAKEKDFSNVYNTCKQNVEKVLNDLGVKIDLDQKSMDEKVERINKTLSESLETVITSINKGFEDMFKSINDKEKR